MKRSIGLIFIATLLVISCNSQTVEKTNQGGSTEKATSAISSGEKVIVHSEPIHLTKQDFLSKVMNYEKNAEVWVYEGELPCLIDFYADWCAPCRITAPILDELAKDYAGKVFIYKIDIQKERELAAVFGVQSIPAFLYCPLEGNPSMTSGISRTPEETKAMFKQNIESILLKKENPANL